MRHAYVTPNMALHGLLRVCKNCVRHTLKNHIDTPTMFSALVYDTIWLLVILVYALQTQIPYCYYRCFIIFPFFLSFYSTFPPIFALDTLCWKQEL